MATFSTQERADKMINSLPDRSPTVYKLAKKYKFNFKIRASGKYYILVAEVFKSKKVLNKSFKVIKRRFKGAYSNNYVAVKKPEVKKVLYVEKPKPSVKPKPLVKKVPVKKIIVEEKKIVKKVKVKQKEIKKEVIVKKEKVLHVEKPKPKPVVQEKISLDINKYLEIFQEYFRWYYAVLLILGSVGFYYYRKFKRIYDEY